MNDHRDIALEELAAENRELREEIEWAREVTRAAVGMIADQRKTISQRDERVSQLIAENRALRTAPAERRAA